MVSIPKSSPGASWLMSALVDPEVWLGPSWARAAQTGLHAGFDASPGTIVVEVAPTWLDDDWSKLDEVPTEFLGLGPFKKIRDSKHALVGRRPVQ